MSFKRLWWTSLFVKIVLGTILPLANDESYYWVWSLHPQLSYFDHPPFVAWLFFLGAPLVHFMQAVRLPAILLGHASLLVWKPIIEKRVGNDKMISFTLLWLACPLTGLSSILVTPDLPLLFFWSLSLLALDYTIERSTVRSYLFLGATLGLTFCAKYHAVLLLPIVVAVLFKSWWQQPNRWRLLGAFVLMGICTSAPVWVWNATHDWVSFRFQLQHGLQSSNWKWSMPLEYVGAQLAILFLPVVYWLTRADRKTHRLFWYAMVIPWGFFLYSSFKARVEANWPMVAFPAAYAMALTANMPKWVERTYFSLTTALMLLLVSHILHPWLPVKSDATKLFEFVRYNSAQEFAAKDNFFACSYQMAADLSFKLKKPIYKIQGMNRVDFYDFLDESKPRSQNFYLGCDTQDELPKWIQQDGYREIRRYPIDSRMTVLEFMKP